MWTATTAGAAFFVDREHCNREQFNALIGPYPGILVSDRWNGYSDLDPNQRQVCWSHLQRDFRRHADGLGEQKTFGEQGFPLTNEVFAAWRSYQHEHHDRDRLQAEIAEVQTELRKLLQDASPKSRRNRWHRQFANNLLKVWPALWTFTITEGVEPTNNPAERALRGPVIHRKVSLGTQSNNGERFAERAHSAAATCRMQGRSLFTYNRPISRVFRPIPMRTYVRQDGHNRGSGWRRNRWKCCWVRGSASRRSPNGSGRTRQRSRTGWASTGSKPSTAKSTLQRAGSIRSSSRRLWQPG